MGKETPQERENLVIQGIKKAAFHLEEGGPDVDMADLIAYVHRILPSDQDTQVGNCISRYRLWNEAYCQAVREKIKADRCVASQDWKLVWSRREDIPSLPLPSHEETKYIVLFAREKMPLAFEDMLLILETNGMRIRDVALIREITQKAILHGFLDTEEVKQEGEWEGYAVRGELEDGVSSEVGIKISRPPEEIMAGICKGVFRLSNSVSKDIEDALITIASLILPSDVMQHSFYKWLQEQNQK